MPGPRWVRTTSGTAGPRRAQPVTTGTNKPQVVVPLRPGPRPLKQGGSGFESHLTAAAGRRPLPTSQASPGRALPCGRPDAYAARPATVVLAGRATTVPFTTDLSGRKRTPTDNPMAAMICAVRRLARWRPRPIWLCKQGVDWSQTWIGLPCPAGADAVPGRGGTGNAVRRPRPDETADPEQDSANLSCVMIPMLD